MPVFVHPHPTLPSLVDRLLPALDAARAEHIAAGLLKPLPIVVPAGQIADWLEIEVARRQGVCLGLDFIKPQECVSRIAALADTAAEHGEDPWTRDALLWRLLPHVQSVAADLGLPADMPLSPRELLATAGELADHLEHYGHSRPELLAAWVQGTAAPMLANAPKAVREAEAWQRRLWLRLRDEILASPGGREHPALVVREQEATLGRLGAQAWPRLLVLGTGGLDPLLVHMLSLLGAAGARIEVHVVLPTLDYLGDLRPAGRRRPLLEDPEAEASIPGNPLVCALGRQAIGSFLLLGQLDDDYGHWPEPSFPEEREAGAVRTLLGRLQDGIRRNVPPAEEEGGGEAPTRIQASDTSLRVHCCHGPRRELEVLRDALLRCFAEMDNLKPEEVLVLCADLDTYAPLAAPVLGSGASPLPVRLTEVPARAGNPLLAALCSLLEQAQGRHTASGLLGLLRLPAVRQGLRIEGDDSALERVEDWLRQSGLTRDFDAADRVRRGLPEDEVGTWRFARDRLLSGLLLGPDCTARDAQGRHVLPQAGTLGDEAQLRLRLAQWLQTLETHLREWSVPAAPALWSERLNKAVDELLCPDLRDKAAAELHRHLSQLSTITVTTALDAGALFDWLSGLLERKAASRTQITGDICFGRPKQLSQLPCRVLALVGFQDGVFPRAARTQAWDLLQLSPRRWDRNPRSEDRQLFLDALVTPTERLIITASARNARTGKQEPLSSCVEELLRHAEQVACLVADSTERRSLRDLLVVQHRLQPFASEYFRAAEGGPPPLPASYDTSAFAIAKTLARAAGAPAAAQAFVPPSATGDEAAQSAEASGAAAVQNVEVSALIDFWKDPAKAWLKAQGITLPNEEGEEADLDLGPLQLEGLQKWQVRDTLVRHTLKETFPLAYTRDLLMGERLLPTGALGAEVWQQLHPQACALGQEIRRVRDPEIRVVDLQFRAGDARLRLVRRLEFAKHEGRECVLAWRAGSFDKPAYQLQLWVTTLVATCALQRPIECLVLDDAFLENGEASLLPGIAVEEAGARLDALAAGWRAGQLRPLCFAPATSAALAKSLDPEKTPEELVRAAAEAQWHNEDRHSKGEGLARHARLVWRDLDPFDESRRSSWLAWAEAVSLPLIAWAAPTKKGRST